MFSSQVLSVFLMLSFMSCQAFNAQLKPPSTISSRPSLSCRSPTALGMGLDMVTYLRVEWISAALCTNQTPVAADVCLQIGCEDGRGVTFIPRTIQELITSTVEPDGIMPVKVKRQLTQQQQTRNAAVINFKDQRADDLSETPDESVDIVISLQASQRMIETGLDWKKSVQEAARVLKPGGRLLFVEATDLNGDSFLDYVDNLGLEVPDTAEGENDEKEERFPVFEEVGYDDVDLVLIPHVAGVALKSMDAGMTASERQAKEAKVEEDRLGEIAISAFERGIKKRKKKKKAKKADEAEV
jgi:SAM-dependent methyltransferase